MKVKFDDELVDYLLSPQAIRDKTQIIYKMAQKGGTHFDLHPEKLDEVTDYVLEVIKDNYPTYEIPFHSRWGHFRAGGVDREKQFDHLITGFDAREKAKAKIDLALVSVLLDAGAGNEWSYQEQSTGSRIERSEGLAVASYHMFVDSKFGPNFSVQAKHLQDFSVDDLIQGFQITESNPLIGVEGRTQLLQSLGKVLAAQPNIFPNGRPGDLLDFLAPDGESIHATDLLRFVLKYFGGIWPSRLEIKGVSLGDIWEYALPSGEKELIVFHKLSQWLTYSLIEPIEEAGIDVIGVNLLTGLAEYRNGGLLLDSGLISLKDQTLINERHRPDSALIIEWRALTLVFLDKMAPLIREKLGKSEEEFPLAKMLEGGTWWAGRRLAKKRCELSSPPIQLASDGTVF